MDARWIRRAAKENRRVVRRRGMHQFAQRSGSPREGGNCGDIATVIGSKYQRCRGVRRGGNAPDDVRGGKRRCNGSYFCQGVPSRGGVGIIQRSKFALYHQRMYWLRSRFCTSSTSLSLTISAETTIRLCSITSGTSYRISSRSVVRIVCKRLAPIFSTSEFTSAAIRATSRTASSSKVISTPSDARRAAYCFRRAFLGWVRML